jgi:A/G-specific adenine glycosylase
MVIPEKLGIWYDNVKRDLPWRETSNPYKIWLSEIILQQTRVAQGTDYYNRILDRFPDIISLAKAETDEVLKLWQGLGYYSRARNLHETARTIAFEKKGLFPGSYTELLKLKGIGEYTAAAISSIAYNEPKAAVDGNVKRVISRLFMVDEEINSSRGKKLIDSLAKQILDVNNPGRHNQAVMELGATICLPKKPLCPDCPLNTVCMALKENKVAEHPLKYNRVKVKDRFFTYLIISENNKTWLKRRSGSDIWNGLYEFPLIESAAMTVLDDYPELIASTFRKNKKNFQISRISPVIIHKLSHRNIICRFLHILVPGDLKPEEFGFINLNISEFDEYAVPKLIERYINDSGF